MTRRTRATGTVLALALVLLAGGALLAGQGGTLEVTVNYTGPGEVDADHALFLVIYSAADFQPESIIGAQIATANGATVSFENVGAATVYPFRPLRRTGRLERHDGRALRVPGRRLRGPRLLRPGRHRRGRRRDRAGEPHLRRRLPHAVAGAPNSIGQRPANGYADQARTSGVLRTGTR